MTKEDLESVKKAVIRRYPISSNIAFNNLEFELTKEIDTAAVSARRNDKGILKVEKIMINPDFFSKLTFSQRVFVLAHEVCHITLKHFARSEKKPVKDIKEEYEKYCEKEKDESKRKIMQAKLNKKYHNLWNIATDACINAFLKRDGLDFIEELDDPVTGQKMKFVYMDEGLYKSAEKIYDQLVKDYKEDNNQNMQQKSSSSIKNLDGINPEDYKGFDSHEEWTDGEPSEVEDESEDYEDENNNPLEKDKKSRESSNNGKFKNVKDSLSKLREGIGLNDIKYAPPVLSWKRLLVGSLEKEEEVWGRRRASRFNPNARIEERTYETLPDVEVILDTSGSISHTLLKGFLLQLHSLFDYMYGQEISLKIGCFGDYFSGFTIIKSKGDIIKFKPSDGGGTDYEVAATSFTKDPGRKITKIVFTDGGSGAPQVTKVDGIFWIVFGPFKKSFKPLSGIVIGVSDKEYNDLINEANKFIKIDDDFPLKL